MLYFSLTAEAKRGRSLSLRFSRHKVRPLLLKGIIIMKDGLRQYVDEFFKTLSVYEDETRGHDFKTYITQAIRKFLDDENKATAFDVYLSFFDAYKIDMGEESNQFLDLLDMMRNYEEHAAAFTEKQRDHYVHSVNVFILGLAVFGSNSKYRKAFETRALNTGEYRYAYKTNNEEFFYRWGITALFHDVGYPVEIVSKQANRYLNFIVEAVYENAEVSKEKEIRVFLDYEDFSRFNNLPDTGEFEEFCNEFIRNHGQIGLDGARRPIDLLAWSIHESFGIDFLAVKNKLDGFLKDMQSFGFVDHGFYSAVIVLQWYAYLIQKSRWNRNYFFTPILDCASAILLHNYYGNVLQKPPFALGPMSPETQPLAYLLLLCDELQEWNREAYGYMDKRRITAERSDVSITGDSFKITYVSDHSLLGDDFERGKEEILNKRIDLSALFPNGFTVNSVNAESALWRIRQSFDTMPPVARPLLGQLENIAKEIHARYLADQMDKAKGGLPEIREWEDLPEDIKYSNLSQARHIVDKLRLIGCAVTPKENRTDLIREFSEAEVEYLSIVEHHRWVEERVSSGWIYGEAKDPEKRVSPYIVPWDDLTEDIKELDRNTVRNISSLLDTVGLGIYRTAADRDSSKNVP